MYQTTTSIDHVDFSHSKLDVARSCWLKFKYQYIDKIKDMPEDRSASDFGEVCHYISEHYTGNGKEELLALYHKALKNGKEPIVLNEDYKKRIPLAIKNIHDYWYTVLKPLSPESVKKEEEIKIKLNEHISLNGKIDIHIVYPNGRSKITDLKTNKSYKFKDHRNQLAMYMLLLKYKWNIPYEQIDTDILYLALEDSDKYGNKIINEGYENIHKSYKLDEIDVECLKTEIETIYEQLKRNIERNQWKAKPTKFGCKFCKFNSICKEKFND
jgi:hypothetical protein